MNDATLAALVVALLAAHLLHLRLALPHVWDRMIKNIRRK